MKQRATRLLGLTVLLAASYALLGIAAANATQPLGMVCTNGPNFTLKATSGHIETPDGNSVFMWSYANDATGGSFQEPGPVLCVNQGDAVSVTLHNGLAENVSIVFPGQDAVSVSALDPGAPGLFTREAAPSGSVSYTFTASQPGTYLYESGTDPSKQVEMGLYGALVVRPKVSDVPGGAAGHSYAYDNASTEYDPKREYLLVFHAIDPNLHQAVELGNAYDFNAIWPRYFTVTGRAFPDTIENNGVSFLPTQPYGSLVRVKPYDAGSNALPAVVRMVNASFLNHPFHPHGFHLRTIAQDGRMLLTPSGGDASSEHFGDVIPAGASQDALFKYVDKDQFCAGNACTALGWSQKPLPVTIPSYLNLRFKDNQTFYSGSPYMGTKGPLPTVVTSFNVCGEFYFPWHSHALNEFVNYDVGFGGMATLLRVDPLPGCTAFATATKINTSGGTFKSGTFADLSAGDTAYYQVNSAASGVPATQKTDWYASFTDVATGSTNLKVTYRGKNSPVAPAFVSCNQSLWIWKWPGLGSWQQIQAPVAVRMLTRTFRAETDAQVAPEAGLAHIGQGVPFRLRWLPLAWFF